MKTPVSRKTLLIGAAMAFAVSAQAFAGGFSSGLESTIHDQKNLNQFENLIARTQVVPNLPAGRYTVFAPVDSAFVKIDGQKFPCFYSPQCEKEQADILRNHIVEGEVNLGDAARGKGAVFAVDKRRVNVAEPTKGEYYVEGHKVLSTHMNSGGVLYVIDGVIASEQELVDFRNLKNPPVVETTTRQTTVQTTVPEPDTRTTTTTTTTTKVHEMH